MPNILPGVEVTVTDKSNIILQSPNLVKFASIGEFARGVDEPMLIATTDQFKKYFGEYEDISSSYGKQAYITCIKILEQAPLYVANVLKNARFGGLGVKAATISQLAAGVTTNRSYDFTPTITNEAKAVTGTAYTGGTTNFPVIPSSVTITWEESAVAKTATDDGAGNIVGDVATGTNTITYSTGALTGITFDAEPDDGINITYTYNTQYLFVVLAYSPKTWSDNFGIKITDWSSTDYTFTINEYNLVNGNDVLIKSYTVSRDPEAVDGFGNRIYIEEVVKAKSDYFVVINNTDITSTTTITNGTTVTYLDGGTNGDAISSVEKVAVIEKFKSPEVSWNIWVGGGETAKTVLDEISTVVNLKDQTKFAFADTIADTAANIVTWATSTLMLDDMRMAFYTPNAYVSYNGKEVYCPASALVANKYAESVNNGKKYMPPAGVDRGTVNVVRLERYYIDAECLDLNNVEVNNIKKIPGYNNVIFGDYTMQSKTSSTSFINCVLTLNDMIQTFNSYLVVIDFKVINDFTILELKNLITTYLNSLALNEGTIKADYKLNITPNEDEGTITADVIFVFQRLVQKVKLNLTYTSNELYAQLS